jgi:predicted nucleic acid-binding protein
VSSFVDTSALYALLVRTEARHRDVAKAFERLLTDGRPLHTTSYCLVETVALLQHRVGLDPVRDLHEHLLPVLEVEWVGGDLHARGYQRLLREDRRRLSLVDCVSFEHMETLGIRDAMALDAHFAEAGFRVLPATRAAR